MLSVIHCVRHGEGFHNVGGGCYTIPDPRLSLTGENQCESLREDAFRNQSGISLILSSPMCRALQTAALVFQPALTSALQSERILAFPDAQETSSDPCDIGSDPEILRRIVGKEKWPVDLSLVTDGWNQKKAGARYSPSNDAIRARARDARLFLRATLRELVSNGDDDAEIVLVSHGGFMHYLTGDRGDAYRHPGTGWDNCETRAYSRWRRGRDHPMYGKEVQGKLFTTEMECWQGQGLQRPDEVDLDLKVG
ncbi:histidine phosphatase family protein [Aspergillus fijiensis CBS 313.89]|uniref:Phosphoglycerate mutase-like protein n=1 Tax=Aspergillus fijiensis CBS 313.89 TaxID=1448319 RepID=A0A8G1RK07_9EURO|nr:phosphoglycerate mutase-like protein [Aspergillus fijiensis CBS 313.89]RAK74705.1 phosphoglycerate mutase-like protein [Aspergillus fijiensis CBS 313.89]